MADPIAGAMSILKAYLPYLKAISRPPMFPLNVEEFFKALKENYANPLVLTLLFQAGTVEVTQRIRKNVLKGDAKQAAEQAWRLKESYKDTFTMEAVAAAIIAQIAINMLGLLDFGTIHWTATAFAYTSLISGLLSTYFSFYVWRILSNLHTAEDVREWLTSPRIRKRLRNKAGESANRDDTHDRIPSLTAAATLTAPARLLSYSITTLFVALGIYLGSVYTEKLGALKGRNANLAVLLVFIIFTTYSILEIYLPLNSKQLEPIITKLLRDTEEPELQSVGPHNDKVAIRATTEAASSAKVSETEATIQQALKASIHAQEESLKAHKALLQFICKIKPQA